MLAAFFALPALHGADTQELPWSFAPLKRPDIPEVQRSDWPRVDLDRFILARLEAEDLRPNEDADRHTLIRRAALDLTGLLPSREEIDTFLRDPSSGAQAFGRVVDGYLGSERFGERWARHWLDVARYADSVGRTWNAPFTYAWRYRDWVIDSLNADKSYDHFIAEQLAGDLLPAGTVEQRREQLVGTGFLTLGSLAINSGSSEPFVMDQVDDQIDVTTRAFLGLTVACARCHDHKYDPVTQKDYYALAGVFYSSWTYPGQAHVSDQGGHGYVDPEMLLRLPGDTGSPLSRVRNVPAGVHSMTDANRDGGAKRAPAYDLHPDFAMGMLDGKPVDCALRIGGNAHDKGSAPKRGDLRIPGLPSLPKIPAEASGRLELAQWIASPTHPLTSRVAANRIWERLFGQGIVETVDDFGFTGREPSHPELLDHLAIRFVESGWSIKKLIREIMLSRTYQLGSAGEATALAKDPDNRLHWRMRPRRLEFEALRDSLLQVSGLLNFDRPEGIQIAGTGGQGRVGRTVSLLGFDAPYRTIYLPVLRDLLPEEYGTFDFPDPASVNGKRHRTTSPPQALFFMNSAFVEEVAEEAARRLLEMKLRDDRGRVEQAYLEILSRVPNAAEIDESIDLLDGQRPGGVRDPELHRWTTLVQALMASTEFRYVL